MTAREPRKIAIVGGGIAGLSSAFLLKSAKSNPEHESYHVTIFERSSKLGMDAEAVDVDISTGKLATTSSSEVLRLNTPPRSFSKGYYHNLIELYKIAQVETQPWSWAYSTTFLGESRSFFRLGKSTVLGFRLPSIQWWRWFSPNTFYTIKDGIRFHSAIINDMDNPILCSLTVREYVKHIGLSDYFVQQTLLPLLSMICTCCYDACLNYPIDVVMHYFATNSSHGQYRTKYGTWDAVSRLSAHVDRVTTSCSVNQVIRRGKNNPKPKLVYSVAGGEPIEEQFDDIIMAVQANDLLWMVSELCEEEKHALQAFKHEKSQVVVHTDASVMPPDQRDWSPMNVILPADNTATMFSIWANDTYPSLRFNLFETWNPIVPLAPEKVLRTITFERPLVTTESLEAVEILNRKFSSKGGVYYSGAWTCHRIPLQESGVVSALRVTEQILGRMPAGDWVTNSNHGDVIRAMKKDRKKVVAGKEQDTESLLALPTVFQTLNVGIALVGTAIGISLGVWYSSGVTPAIK